MTLTRNGRLTHNQVVAGSSPAGPWNAANQTRKDLVIEKLSASEREGFEPSVPYRIELIGYN